MLKAKECDWFYLKLGYLSEIKAGDLKSMKIVVFRIYMQVVWRERGEVFCR